MLPSKDGFPETSVVVACAGISLANPRRVFYRQLLACALCPVLERKEEKREKEIKKETKKENMLKTRRTNAQTTRTSKYDDVPFCCCCCCLQTLSWHWKGVKIIKTGIKHMPGSRLALIMQIWRSLNQGQTKKLVWSFGAELKNVSSPSGTTRSNKVLCGCDLVHVLNNHTDF